MQLAVGVEQLAASGEYLMAVGLVSHVPHYSVVGGIKNVMESHGQLHHAKA